MQQYCFKFFILYFNYMKITLKRPTKKNIFCRIYLNLHPVKKKKNRVCTAFCKNTVVVKMYFNKCIYTDLCYF